MAPCKASTDQPKRNPFNFFIFLSGNSWFPLSSLKSSTNWSVSWKIIPYSRPKLSDLYTPSQSKLLENHTLHSGTYLYRPYMAVPPGPHSITVKYNKLNTFCEIQPSNRTFDPGGIPYLSHICMCLPKGRVLAPFWSEKGDKPWPFWSGIRFGFRGATGVYELIVVSIPNDSERKSNMRNRNVF